MRSNVTPLWIVKKIASPLFFSMFRLSSVKKSECYNSCKTRKSWFPLSRITTLNWIAMNLLIDKKNLSELTLLDSSRIKFMLCKKLLFYQKYISNKKQKGIDWKIWQTIAKRATLKINQITNLDEWLKLETCVKIFWTVSRKEITKNLFVFDVHETFVKNWKF